MIWWQSDTSQKLQASFKFFLQCYMVKNSLIKKPDKCKLKLTPLPPQKNPAHKLLKFDQ